MLPCFQTAYSHVWVIDGICLVSSCEFLNCDEVHLCITKHNGARSQWFPVVCFLRCLHGRNSEAAGTCGLFSMLWLCWVFRYNGVPVISRYLFCGFMDQSTVKTRLHPRTERIKKNQGGRLSRSQFVHLVNCSVTVPTVSTRLGWRTSGFWRDVYPIYPHIPSYASQPRCAANKPRLVYESVRML